MYYSSQKPDKIRINMVAKEKFLILLRHLLEIIRKQYQLLPTDLLELDRRI